MRFRLPATQQTTDSFGRGFANLFSSPMYEAQAAEEAQNSGMKRQLMEAQIADHIAQSALHGEQARGARVKTDALASAPDLFSTIVAASAGTDVPTLNRYREGIRTGAQPGSATGDADTDAMIGIQSQPAVDPEIGRKLLQALQRNAPGMVNPDALKMNDTSAALGHYQEQDLLSQVLAGQRTPQQVGPAIAATKGNSLVQNVGNTGRVMDRFSGGMTTADPAMAALFDNEGKALIGQRNASAGASNAAANLSGARRERVAGGYDKPVTVVDEDSGEASVTRIPTGADPITVGVAPKKGSGKDATLQKERNRVTTAVEKDMVGASDAEIAAEVERRMSRRTGAPAPAAAPTPAPAPSGGIDMAKAADIKARVKAGTLSRAEGVAQLKAIGFK